MLTAAGAGAGSFAVLIGAVAQRVPAQKRSFASGFVNAGGSLGQFVFAPLNQLLISTIGWMGAMWAMAGAALATIPLARRLTRGHDADRRCGRDARRLAVPAAASALSMREQLAIAARDKSYWCLHAGFFTCGFHIAFLVTHLPGEVKLCSLPAAVAASSLSIIGLANVAGSLWAGWAGGVVRMKYLLFAMYFSRAVAVAIYLAAPKTALTFYLFAAVLGFTWLATVPPTAGLIGKLFGVRYLATLVRPRHLHAPDRRLLRRLAGRHRAGALRRLLVDVVRRHRAGAAGGVREPADPRGAAQGRSRCRRELARRAPGRRAAARHCCRGIPCRRARLPTRAGDRATRPS